MILSCVLLWSVPITANAENIHPYYTDTNRVQLTLTFSSNNATCSGTISGKTGTTSITNCTITITDSNGIVAASWDGISSNSSVLTFKRTASVTKGETYTLSVTATVNRNGSSETVSGSITKTY